MQYITFRLQTDCNQTFHPHLFPLNTFYTSYTSRVDIWSVYRCGAHEANHEVRED